jgi:hypothetical protein
VERGWSGATNKLTPYTESLLTTVLLTTFNTIGVDDIEVLWAPSWLALSEGLPVRKTLVVPQPPEVKSDTLEHTSLTHESYIPIHRNSSSSSNQKLLDLLICSFALVVTV